MGRAEKTLTDFTGEQRSVPPISSSVHGMYNAPGSAGAYEPLERADMGVPAPEPGCYNETFICFILLFPVSTFFKICFK